VLALIERAKQKKEKSNMNLSQMLMPIELGTMMKDVWIRDIPRSKRRPELPMDVNEWKTTSSIRKMTTAKNNNNNKKNQMMGCDDDDDGGGWVLRLEEWTQYDHNIRGDVQRRNIQRLQKAMETYDDEEGIQEKSCVNVQHIQLHYSVCLDPLQRRAIIDLLESKERWGSITMTGMMYGMMDWYSRPITSEEEEGMESLFYAFRTVQCLNLYSCQWFRGYGLDILCKFLPNYIHLEELRLHGWQWDRVSFNAFQNSLQQKKKIPTTTRSSSLFKLLSLQSCTFQAERVIQDMIQCLSTDLPMLETLNVSYCNLSDDDIVCLVEQFQQQQEENTMMINLRHLHLGGNHCTSVTSVNAISEWIKKDTCPLMDINLRALWVAYSEEHGMLERPISLSQLYETLEINTSLKSLNLSENMLDNTDISQLMTSLKRRSIPLIHLDIGDNPFSSEEVSRSILDFVSNGRTTTTPGLKSLRFENPYLTYQDAPLIHFHIRYQWYHHRIQTVPSARFRSPPLSSWPCILSSLANHHHHHHDQDDVVVGPCVNPTSPEDLIYSFLQSTTGTNGHILGYRIAKHSIE